MLEQWTGTLGDEYTDRQPPADTGPELRRILAPVWDQFDNALEVGCNRGDNLRALTRDKWVWGVEPNEHARRLARRVAVEEGHAGALPFADGTHDLVFTVGVLIHIPPEELARALHEIHRVSRRFILAVEYEAEVPIPLDYRGVRAGIWKRDYGHEYYSRFPLNLVATGATGDVFDGCTYWLFDKRPGVSVR